MRAQRLMLAVTVGALASAPAAMARLGPPIPSPPLPAGGVFVQGLNGLRPNVHSHPHLCQAEMREDRFRCILGKGQEAILTFDYRGATQQGCAFRVWQGGDPPHGDFFHIGRHRVDFGGFHGRCGTNVRSQRQIEVFPTH